jgi:LPPG:FO 2-phospho-L-lactate transferase
MRVALLAGGTGGAKLAAGIQEELGSDLTVIANTGDDVEVLGVHVSPDPDLVTYWLSGEIDEERGWGIREDTFTVFERLQRLGAPSWFGLSDRDLAACLYRRQFVAEGGRPTDAQAQIARELGVEARVLPMSDSPVRTKVLTAAGRRDLQEYLIVDRGEPDVLGVELEGIEGAEPSREVLDALRAAEAIVIGPSNPVISIGPILAVPGMREAIASSPAPVVAVSPYVAGEVVKGPTDRFMRALGRPTTAAGVASLYAGLIDGMVVDEDDPDPAPAEVPTLAAATLMEGAGGRARVARIVLDYASGLVA